MAELNEAGEVRSAGGVVWRRSGKSEIEVALVHRPKYDDWSIPKGKAEPGESDEECARREVEEETGLTCRLGDELPTVRYRDRYGRPKVARYWAMRPENDDEKFRPHAEVDELCWLSLDRALERLSYERDREVLRAVADVVAS